MAINSIEIESSSERSDSANGSSIDDEKKVVHGNSALLTAGIIIADVVGAGILSMPSAIAKLGWLIGGIVVTIMLVANVHISLLMWRVRMGVENGAQCRTYSDLCDAAFSKAPTWQRKGVSYAAQWSQSVFLFLLLGVYLLSAGKGLGMVFYNLRVCLPYWAMIAAALLFPFAGSARQMGAYQSLVWINVITLCGTVCLPLLYYVVYGMDEIRPGDAVVVPVAQPTPSGVLYALSTFTFGMTSQFMLAEIMSEMKDPAEFPRAYVRFSAPFQLVAFLVAGLAGYCFIGDKVAGMINENLPFNTTFQLSAACLVTHMLISWLIKGVVFTQQVHSLVFPKFQSSEGKRVRLSWAMCAAFVMFLSWLIANTIPFFSELVDLLGASLTPISCWLIPIAMYIRWHKDAGDAAPPISKVEGTIMALEVLLALVLMTVGTYSSVVSITESWAEFGNPFECHCEGMWNTCECDAMHPGMLDTCAVALHVANQTLAGR